MGEFPLYMWRFASFLLTSGHCFSLLIFLGFPVRRGRTREFSDSSKQGLSEWLIGYVWGVRYRP